MVFTLLVLILNVVFCFILWRKSDPLKLTKPLLVTLLISLISNVSLAQNYTHSLIPGANDGIGISNFLAYWIITDETTWSVQLFKFFYTASTIISTALVILLVFVFLFEREHSSD